MVFDRRSSTWVTVPVVLVLYFQSNRIPARNKLNQAMEEEWEVFQEIHLRKCHNIEYSFIFAELQIPVYSLECMLKVHAKGRDDVHSLHSPTQWFDYSGIATSKNC